MSRLLASVLFVVSLSALAEGPIDHKIPPGYIPEEADDEKGLWMEMREYEDTLRKSALLVTDRDINLYVGEIVCRVAKTYCNDFRIYVIRNPGFNASMTATGMMQIWTGLIVRAESSDDIAAVIGHEIAHYTRLHSLERLRAMKKRMATGTFFDLAVAITTGYGTNLGQATAALSVLAHSRGQEMEADILGTKLLADAAYDPHSSYGVWRRLLAEEEAAAVKREEPGIFAMTHPPSVERAEYLEAMVENNYGPPDAEPSADQRFLDILNTHYMLLMEDQLDTNRFGRTEELLNRHRALGVSPSLVRYFYGEMFRQRGLEGDEDLAKNAYLYAIELGDAPADAFNNLGYLYMKSGDMNNARKYFRQYLDIDPDASDRAMIEYYLEDTQ